MQTCRARRGFFTLRDCGERAAKQCALCARPMCSPHLSPQSGFTRCLDCEGRAVEKDVLTTPGKKDAAPSQAASAPLTDPAWSHRYRDRYYSSSGYAPFYWGAASHDPYYDSYDTRSFDSDMAGRGPSTVDETDSGTGLEDS